MPTKSKQKNSSPEQPNRLLRTGSAYVPSVLVVDDPQRHRVAIGREIKRFINGTGTAKAQVAESFLGALVLLKNRRFDLVIMHHLGFSDVTTMNELYRERGTKFAVYSQELPFESDLKRIRRGERKVFGAHYDFLISDLKTDIPQIIEKLAKNKRK